MTIDEIVTLIQAVSDNGLTSFEYEEGDQKLVLKKKKKKKVVAAPMMSAMTMPAMPMAAPAVELAVPAAGAAVNAAALKTAEAPAAEAVSGNVIVSPLVGTFYSSASPENPPFVKAGDTVKKGQVMGIIEAMKLMNEIESEFDGVVEEVLVDNESVVEFGQPLFRIR
ncbi:MAG: acetyl-CoA carboxylase biotin carboxyl carrier protein [Lachnospiraceae bacterium]|nr:acetyl-CoA carboxylase biotin carboxyl carrier protein [Lachnospiraceae bacterium]